jgi:hypothetical protein
MHRQTSPESGKIQQMGKGFRTHEGIEGTELRVHFEDSLKRRVVSTFFFSVNALTRIEPPQYLSGLTFE